MTDKVIIADARKHFHAQLIRDGVLSLAASGIASNADCRNRFSCEIAKGIAEKLGVRDVADNCLDTRVLVQRKGRGHGVVE